jgi:transposase
LAKAAPIGSKAGGPVAIWFQDEARVGQQGTHAYIWAPVGSRPLMVRDNRHVSTYIFGAICPEHAVGAALIMPYANTSARTIASKRLEMNEHLKEISTQVAPGAHAILVCGGAGLHQRGAKLLVPDYISLLSLPAYSPEPNPMENVSDYLMARRGRRVSKQRLSSAAESLRHRPA